MTAIDAVILGVACVVILGMVIALVLLCVGEWYARQAEPWIFGPLCEFTAHEDEIDRLMARSRLWDRRSAAVVSIASFGILWRDKP